MMSGDDTKLMGDGGDSNTGTGADSLDFADIPHGEGLSDVKVPIHSDRDGLLGGGASPSHGGSSSSSSSCFSIGYYADFFDVTTTQVRQRLTRALVPSRTAFYTPDDPKPDLYGPFWVATTLIVMMSVSGNAASYLTFDPTKPSSGGATWSTDFEKVTIAATLIYASITLFPLAVWMFLQKLDVDKSLTEVVSIYGYSLCPFVPASLLSILPVNVLRWVFMLAAYGVSVHFLVRNLYAYFALAEQKRQLGYVFLLCMTVGHFVLDIVLKLYFFS